ncbi:MULTISPECIES: acyl-CoA dehydrogenase family protein [Rhodococcus]|uniref:Acyl-CoA dehydrogenase family protein n=1 Tax=Rhodococcus oxybenzonivorans TaxID=1990687 RepID=A0AAE4UYV8_9NOCA|nr:MULTISPECIES: acyl-CoA dehydrogenase family protein [Rhodococcus]MDV7241850.1 acyl-CoA dehydrogenase family protein [Rhodococcus oxybenzonivorans]MDV7265496.1 acyl-CoA dehydrogenase family protein [Rhodococcus oxybenzonivorans]MDV7273616.1 acyl-CoA dehydrogenase family protein [Rhodococcus oxybenzonivorans]MDV7334132.1 acyl-CoA dehydrogenase family protein [Rhodococcus oxybenzonivorans]MDV7343551.1 acyl-CoA dehydrogenase family protein [Rhodococcus oxybenzonivorans]
MEPTIGSKALTREQREKYLESLNEETLSALMRSTWTWDDRALRRTLSELVTDLTAVRELRVGEVGCPAPVLEAAESRVLAATGEFVAEVLGPRLLVDADNAFRESLLPLVEATGALTAEASRALDTLAVEVTGQVIERNESLSAILPEDRWEEKAFSGSATGLARVGYSAGYTLADRDYFAAAGLGAQAYTIAGSPIDDSVDVHRSTLAAAEKTGSWDPALVRTRAEAADGGWQLTGEKWYVPSADTAGTLFVIARTVGGPSLYRVEHDAPGVTIESLDSLDPTRPLARVGFEETPATLIGREGAGGLIMNRTVDRATTVLAAEQMGIVDRALKCLSDVPPAAADSESWRGYTRKLAELELLRACSTALWYRAVKLQGGDDPNAASIAAGMAHIGCSNAVRQVVLRLTSVTPDLDTTVVRTIAARARYTDLLLGGPALAHERLLERLGV